MRAEEEEESEEEEENRKEEKQEEEEEDRPVYKNDRHSSRDPDGTGAGAAAASPSSSGLHVRVWGLGPASGSCFCFCVGFGFFSASASLRLLSRPLVSFASSAPGFVCCDLLECFYYLFFFVFFPLLLPLLLAQLSQTGTLRRFYPLRMTGEPLLTGHCRSIVASRSSGLVACPAPRLLAPSRPSRELRIVFSTSKGCGIVNGPDTMRISGGWCTIGRARDTRSTRARPQLSPFSPPSGSPLYHG